MNTYLLECKLEEFEKKLDRRLATLERKLKALDDRLHDVAMDVREVRRSLAYLEERVQR